jgi:hypothetical protein
LINGRPAGQTPAYIQLIIAFGLARLGEADTAGELLGKAEADLRHQDEAHQILLKAFNYRITQALEGKPHTGSLPAELLESLNHVGRKCHYAVDRLRECSRILEPDQKIDPYRYWGARIDDFHKALAELTDLTDHQLQAERVQKMLREVPEGAKGHEQRIRVLRAGLEAAPRLGEEFAKQVLKDTVGAYDALPEPRGLPDLMGQAALLERALFVAAHFGCAEYVRPLVARFEKMLENQKGPDAVWALDSLAWQFFRGLRKLGMRDEVGRLASLTANTILQGQTVEAVNYKSLPHGVYALKGLLLAAACWYYLGRDRLAEAILQAARSMLQDDLHTREEKELACSYAVTVAQAPVEMAQERLKELCQRMHNLRDTYTTSSHFNVWQLEVVEAAVLAVVERTGLPPARQTVRPTLPA